MAINMAINALRRDGAINYSEDGQVLLATKPRIRTKRPAN